MQKSHFYSLNEFLRARHGEKILKLSIDGVLPALIEMVKSPPKVAYFVVKEVAVILPFIKRVILLHSLKKLAYY